MASGMDFSDTSAQLQVLNHARLVKARRHGKRVVYRLADFDVVRFLNALRELSRARLAEVEQVARDYFDARDELEPISSAKLLDRIQRREVLVIDVMPKEYEAGHTPGAISVPLAQLGARLPEL